jgi:hypothetical protein
MEATRPHGIRFALAHLLVGSDPMPRSVKVSIRIGTVLAMVSTVGLGWPRVVAGRGHARDPTAQMEHQRRRMEDRKTKRREQHDLEGAEMRDQKKSAQDGHQSQTQSELGTPNQQPHSWFGF